MLVLLFNGGRQVERGFQTPSGRSQLDLKLRRRDAPVIGQDRDAMDLVEMLIHILTCQR
jgi:hypothetical protein